jgi:hypothetical protein
MSRKRSEKKTGHRASWEKFITNLVQRPMGLKVYTVLRQISSDIKEIVKIHGYMEENVFPQYCEKLWNTTNIN